MHSLGRLARWFHRRWGQMVCFGMAGGYLFVSGYSSGFDVDLGGAVMFSALLATGVALKVIALRRWNEK